MMIVKAFRAIARIIANHCIIPVLRHWLFRLSGIVIGKNAYVNMGFISVDSYEKDMVTIETEAVLSPNVTLVTVSYPNNSFIGVEYDIVKQGKIVVKHGAWLGVNVVVLPGITIGKGAIIGAGAVVTRDVPDFAIMVGIPARKIDDVRNKSRKGSTSPKV